MSMSEQKPRAVCVGEAVIARHRSKIGHPLQVEKLCGHQCSTASRPSESNLSMCTTTWVPARVVREYVTGGGWTRRAPAPEHPR